VLETPFESTFGGSFRMIIYRNSIDETEHAVLTRGRIDPDKPTLVRMHRVDLAVDMLGSNEARRGHVPKALKAMADYDGASVAVFIRDSNPHWLSERYGQPNADQSQNVLRDYGIGAQILLDLGVRDMLLLSSSTTVLPGSGGYGLKIVGRAPLD
jgi:3,4-dihydroxy 2-butanone 4-phosphate synthase/GTP cyclohydrolase II